PPENTRAWTRAMLLRKVNRKLVDDVDWHKVTFKIPGSGFWPFWLGVIMLASCVWTGINWALRRTPASVSTAPFLDSYGWKMLLTVGGGLIGFLLVIKFLGFYAAMLAFLVYYIRFIGRHGWAVTLSIATAVPVVCFFFFDIAMRIVLPKGYSEPLFIPLYDIFL
ncbi:MAG: tripartite tricarboxylate transporter TctB family protein, partial [Candidatus Puniceispirillaceae bacterium]